MLDLAKNSPHLDIQDLIDTRDTCPLCLSHQPREAIFVLQRAPTIEWLYCPICKGYSASMMPTDAYLNTYYTNYYSTDRTKVTIRRPEVLAGHIAKLLPAFAARDVSIADIGGGDGTVAKLLAVNLHKRYPEKRLKITLVDYNQEENTETEDYNFQWVPHISALGGQKFNIVLASTVIEHVPQAHGFIAALFDILKPGGYLYARTPSVTHLKRILARYPLQYPMHVHDLGASFWNRVPNRYPHSIALINSQPSLVASTFSHGEFLKTCLAYGLKLPAHVERIIRRSPKDYFWKLVGGWEVLIRNTE